MSSQSDEAIAMQAASLAGELLLQLRHGVATDTATASEALQTAGDRDANRAIMKLLANERPEDSLLSEEAADDPRRLIAERVWIIDPLDGTREFGERDSAGVWRDDFAVHVALWRRGHGLTLGVVGLPARGLIYSSDVRKVVPPSPAGPLRIAVSRTLPPGFVAALESAGDATLLPMGSAGVKVMAVVSGEADAYIHAGGQYQWDSAAPVAVALAAGLVATRLDGTPLRYNVPELLLPDLVVCHPDRADEVRALVDAAGFGAGDASGASATRAGTAESPR
ncbi:MAG: 3'(2'),5'-bisphosphate nucleotidase CysQ [Candidatus Limnocylindrus sp.]